MLSLLKDFLRLLFPVCCEVCGTNLVNGEKVLCLRCLRQIPRTYHWQEQNNSAEQIFCGRVPVERACAFFYFSKGSRYRQLLHKLKYKYLPQIGVVLGREFGKELLRASFFCDDSILVPVPLHPKRYRKRGYNQSERIASGISQIAGIPVVANAVIRQRYNETQTQKNRTERFQNVQDIFGAGKEIEQLRGKHVIVVDDVLTTGATIESLITAILRNVECRISVAVIAVGKL
jgi:ComF family protein